MLRRRHEIHLFDQGDDPERDDNERTENDDDRDPEPESIDTVPSGPMVHDAHSPTAARALQLLIGSLPRARGAEVSCPAEREPSAMTLGSDGILSCVWWIFVLVVIVLLVECFKDLARW